MINPPRDDAGNEDDVNLRTVDMRMDEVFGQTHTMPLPDGSLAHITVFSWDEQDDAGYDTVALSVVLLRVEEENIPAGSMELSLT